MNPQNYQCTIAAPITANEAFDKISRVGEWWAVNFKGNAKNLHDRFTVHFARTTWAAMEIVDVVPDQRVVWKVADCYLPIFKDPYVWKDNLIFFDIAADGAEAEVTMTHIGLFPGVECYEDCRKGWNFYIGESLFGLLNSNKGLPGSGIFVDVFVAGRKYEGLLFSKTEPFPDFADGYIILDVRENRGEQVLSAYSVDILDCKSMSLSQLKGEYYIVLENRPVSGDIQPLEDLRNIVVSLAR